VGSRYNVVQPREVLEFYRDLTEVAGYELETAGAQGRPQVLGPGPHGKSAALKGKDVVNGYLLLATSCDGSGYGSHAHDRAGGVQQHADDCSA
jgi:hypothetical protein